MPDEPTWSWHAEGGAVYMQDMEVTKDKASEAAAFLKTLANENRLMVLCHLAQGEKSVTELESLIDIRQPNLSQQLSRLRADGLVKTRRNAKSIYYELDSPEVMLLIQLMYRLFCLKDDARTITLTRDFPVAAE
jgi:DNA-binding transcriptional ArsR family regulator